MSESQTHIDLVNVAYDYVKSTVSPDLRIMIQLDSAKTDKPTHVIGNYIPDVLYCYKNRLIIAEAKTLYDFNRIHSFNQYKAYLNTCNNFEGTSTFVICIPWQLVLSAKNYFHRQKCVNGYSFDIIVLDETGRWFAI